MKKTAAAHHHHTNTAGHSTRTQWGEMGTTELEKGEEGNGRGRRLIKTADFAKEERGRNFYGSRASRRRHPEIARAETKGA
jgi:hypothetical protein